MSTNIVTLEGNLTRDAELRSLNNGGSVLVFGLAVNDSWKNKETGEWEERPNFVDISIYGGRAEAIAKRGLHKGQAVVVIGKLHYESWEKDGQKRNKLSVQANTVTFVDRPGAAEKSGDETPIESTQAPTDVYADEDIPF